MVLKTRLDTPSSCFLSRLSAVVTTYSVGFGILERSRCMFLPQAEWRRAAPPGARSPCGKPPGECSGKLSPCPSARPGPEVTPLPPSHYWAYLGCEGPAVGAAYYQVAGNGPQLLRPVTARGRHRPARRAQ
eukprot:15623315-Heterocapsa_arctica.AAC.1